MSKIKSTSDTPETDDNSYMVECTSVQNYGIEDPSEVVDADFARKLERQRDELLEVLKLCRPHMYEHASNTEDNAFDMLCAAIAKVEGGE